MLKKFLSFVCVAALSVAFVGCDAKTDSGAEATTGSEATETATEDAGGAADASAEAPEGAGDHAAQ